jgi:hypothetical protein
MAHHPKGKTNPQIGVPVTPVMAAFLEARAKTEDRTLSSVVRRMIAKEMEQEDADAA